MYKEMIFMLFFGIVIVVLYDFILNLYGFFVSSKILKKIHMDSMDNSKWVCVGREKDIEELYLRACKYIEENKCTDNNKDIIKNMTRIKNIQKKDWIIKDTEIAYVTRESQLRYMI